MSLERNLVEFRKEKSMHTGYFAGIQKYRNIGRSVNIALKPPSGWSGANYPPLYPSPALLREFKAGALSEEQYTERYMEQLSKLDPVEVYKELRDDAILVCYERPGSFCHRHIVAKWLNDSLGIQVTEAKLIQLPTQRHSYLK